ncbi:MAG: Xaa-Pro peptidase family protein [Treponema sp.]|nr:Xaa-Pro peptidase family protein [Treponema sp.]
MDFNAIYKKRRDKAAAYMKEHNIKAAVFEDSEDRREPTLRYLTGHPSDGALILTDDGKSYLVAWDENLAKEKGHADEILPSEKFKRSYVTAAKEILGSAEKDNILCISSGTPFSQYSKYTKELTDWNICADENKVHDFVKECRAIKDEYEIQCTKKACSITDAMTSEIIDALKKGKIKSEIDVALFIERTLREQGAERTSFDTLAAGPERSFAIHAFPGYTQGPWGTKGLSILDFGVCYEGYASDCTITVAKDSSAEQQKLLDLVETAAAECRKLYIPGKKICEAVKKADEIFAQAGRKMPHGLGHGTGLEIHEEPFVSMRAAEGKKFQCGNIITLEPGLYDKELGGVRLENDVLITESGNEILTSSKIFRF